MISGLCQVPLLMKILLAVLLGLVGAASAGEGGISLAGTWEFSLSGDNGGSQTIKLPGTMNDARLGPENHKPADLAGPYPVHDYTGQAWYRRDIEIPAGWDGMRVTLFLERCRWVTTVWLDDKQVGSRDSLVSPHVYDLGTGLKPGKHRLAIRVDNTVKYDLGQFVSALFGGTWGNLNGIIGRIELNATPTVWLDAVNVYPDARRKTALVKARIGNATGKPGQGDLEVGDLKRRVTWNEQGGEGEIEVPLPDVALWDEFSPNLQTLAVKLGDDQKTVRFGFLDFGVKEKRFVLNGRPIQLRGTLECSVWPLTGYPPADTGSWRKIYQVIRSYGLNHMRFHSWCPPEAAFAAADEEGIILQVEGPAANVPVGKDAGRDAFLEAEYRRMVDTYGNHPSFCLMALGNEFGGDMDTITRWVGMLRERDPRHLYTSASNNRQVAPNRQFTVKPDGRGIKEPGTMRDLGAVVAADPHPVVGHEIGQWMYWPDSREIAKWNGVMVLKNYERVRDDLRRNHLADLETRYVDACGRFATLLYKEEIEVLLRTRDYGGFQLLDLHDYPTQGTALVGPLNAFWESKGFITPERFRRFCGPTVPLLRMPKRTYSSNEPFVAEAEIAHYGTAQLDRASPAWTITDARGRVVASGKLVEADIASGGLVSLGEIHTSLAGVDVPSKLNVELSAGGFANDWDIWVYPAESDATPAEGVVVCDNWKPAKEALGRGGKVLLDASVCQGAQNFTGAFLPVFWSPVWFPNQKPNTMGLLCDPAHPLFNGLPTESHCNWQWYELMRRSRVFILDDTPADYRPIVQVIDNFARNHKLGVVFEGRVGSGKLLVCGFDLKQRPGNPDPTIRRMRNSLLSYMASNAFQPAGSLNPGYLEKLLGVTNSKASRTD